MTYKDDASRTFIATGEMLVTWCLSFEDDYAILIEASTYPNMESRTEMLFFPLGYWGDGRCDWMPSRWDWKANN